MLTDIQIAQQAQLLAPDALNFPFQQRIMTKENIEKRRLFIRIHKQSDQRRGSKGGPCGLFAVFKEQRQKQNACEHRDTVRGNGNQTAGKHDCH